MGFERAEVRTFMGAAAPPWLSSLSDTMTQILCFFVMLYSLTAMIQEKQLKKVMNSIEEHIKNENIKGVKVTVTEKEGRITFEENVLFTPGSAELGLEAKVVLDKLAPALERIPNKIAVEGHTDNQPIATAKFPSNWDLSTARATTVLRYLVEVSRLKKQNLTAAGYSEYRPISNNDTEEGKSRNRRVDFLILPVETQQQSTSGKVLLSTPREASVE